jgi:hypothetical protein
MQQSTHPTSKRSYLTQTVEERAGSAGRLPRSPPPRRVRQCGAGEASPTHLWSKPTAVNMGWRKFMPESEAMCPMPCSECSKKPTSAAIAIPMNRRNGRSHRDRVVDDSASPHVICSVLATSCHTPQPFAWQEGYDKIAHDCCLCGFTGMWWFW